VENAIEIGLKVRKGNDEETVIGVNTKQAELFVDRTRSGNVGFDNKFAGRHAGPIRLDHGKKVKLHIFIDRSSVEVFGNGGECVISERVFPGHASDGVELYAQGEGGRVLRLDVWNLKSVWEHEAQNQLPARLPIQ
jgi:fructan beta-fructosidase